MISISSFRSLRLGVPTALIALSLLSCVQDQDFLLVERAIWFDENCVMNSSSTVTAYPMTVDVAFEGGPGFGIGLVVSNLLSPNDGSNTGIDDSEIVVETAIVTLSFSGGGVAGASFEQTMPSNSIEGQGSDVFLVRVPADTMASLGAAMQGAPVGTIETLEMEVVFRGHRMQFGDRKFGEIETRPYVYPFDICYGCLVSCLCADNMTVSCPGTASGEWIGACGMAQGGAITGTGCPI